MINRRTGKPVEISFFPVPNIDEVQFGTALNKAFGTEVARDLGMGEYKPGSTIKTYLVQYSNIYWAKKASVRCASCCTQAIGLGSRLNATIERRIFRRLDEIDANATGGRANAIG